MFEVLIVLLGPTLTRVATYFSTSFAPDFLQPERRTRRDLKMCEYGAVTFNSFVFEPSLPAVPVRASMSSHCTLMCIFLFLLSFLVSATRNGSAMVGLTCLHREFVIYMPIHPKSIPRITLLAVPCEICHMPLISHDRPRRTNHRLLCDLVLGI